jgi:hypothetical protein
MTWVEWQDTYNGTHSIRLRNVLKRKEKENKQNESESYSFCEALYRSNKTGSP